MDSDNEEVRCVELVSIGLIVTGIVFSTIGATKAIKSKFKDLDAIFWCFVGYAICTVEVVLARFL